MRFLNLSIATGLLLAGSQSTWAFSPTTPSSMLSLRRNTGTFTTSSFSSSSLLRVETEEKAAKEVVVTSATAAAAVEVVETEEKAAKEVVVTSSEPPATAAAAVEVPAAITEVAVKEESSKMSTPAGIVPNTMEEGIFNFNKILIDTVYDVICFLYPVKGTERDFARFYVLETVARVPYFAYLSVMHFRETFGERYDTMSERMRTHYAEADNELHHLLIMESLGGNSNIIDRTLAQTMAFFYYWYVIAIYAWNEPAAYHLSELIEDHAFNTYTKFTAEYEESLKSQPVPEIARNYYERDNPFLFDLFCTVKSKDDDGSFSTRRPELESLYDVFCNIRDDEKEHWKTLCNLVQYNEMNAVDAAEVHSTAPAPTAESTP